MKTQSLGRRASSRAPILLALLTFLFTFQAPAQNLVTTVLTVTNVPVTSNTFYWSSASASSSRYWTNQTTSGTILTNLAGVGPAATNLFNALANNPLLGISMQMTNTNSLVFKGQSLLITNGANGSAWQFWASIVSTTNTGTNIYEVVGPVDNLPPTVRTNQTSDLVYGLGIYATNSLPTNSAAMTNYLSIGIPFGGGIQQIFQRKFFTAGLDAINVRFTNGFTSGLTNINPVDTNLSVFGGLSSAGAGALSTVIGSNAVAASLRSFAAGVSALATNADTTAVGSSAQATTNLASAFGSGAIASGYRSVAAGYGSLAAQIASIAYGSLSQANGVDSIAVGDASFTAPNSRFGIAIGPSSSSGHTNSIAMGQSASAQALNSSAFGAGTFIDVPFEESTALGYGATPTAAHQVRLGTVAEQVSVPGTMQVEVCATNLPLAGTNVFRGSISYPRFDLTTLAAGVVNIAVPFGTNRYIRVGALSTNTTIAGAIGAATTGGLDDNDILLENRSGYPLTLAVSTADPTPGNRFAGTDVIIPDQGFANIMYELTDGRWRVTSVYPYTNQIVNATNAINNLNGNGTNENTWASSSTTVPLTVNTSPTSVTNGWQLLSTNVVPQVGVNSNGQFFVKGVTPASNYVNAVIQGSTNQNTNIFEVKDSAGNIALAVGTNVTSTASLTTTNLTITGGGANPLFPAYHDSTNGAALALNDYYVPLGVTTPAATATGVVLTNGNLRLVPFWSGAGGLVDVLGCRVAAIGSSTIRFGIYQATSANNFSPSNLVFTSGGFDNSASGTKLTNLVSKIRLNPATVYWSGVSAGDGTCAATSVNTTALDNPIMGMTTNFTYQISLEIVTTYGNWPSVCPLTNTIVHLNSEGAMSPIVVARFSAP